MNESDGDLLVKVREGDMAAYAALYRRHRPTALRVARRLTPDPAVAEDAVSEAFMSILRALRTGRGPKDVFGPYLLSSVSRAVHRLYLKTAHERPSSDELVLDGRYSEDFGDEGGYSTLREAFESLPPRWKAVIWYVDIESRKPREVGGLLHLSGNAAVALHRRALAGLRSAYLSKMVQGAAKMSKCPASIEIPAFVAGAVTAGRRERISLHLPVCVDCSALLRESVLELNNLGLYSRRWIAARHHVLCA